MRDAATSYSPCRARAPLLWSRAACVGVCVGLWRLPLTRSGMGAQRRQRIRLGSQLPLGHRLEAPPQLCHEAQHSRRMLAAGVAGRTPVLCFNLRLALHAARGVFPAHCLPAGNGDGPRTASGGRLEPTGSSRTLVRVAASHYLEADTERNAVRGIRGCGEETKLVECRANATTRAAQGRSRRETLAPTRLGKFMNILRNSLEGRAGKIRYSNL